MTVDSLESVLAHRPHSPLFARLADSYFTSGNISEAKELCRSGLLQYPRYATGHLILAKCFAAENNYEEALSHLHHALFSLPGNTLLEQLNVKWRSELEKSSDTTTIAQEELNENVEEPLLMEQPEEVHVILPEDILPSTEPVITETVELQQSQIVEEVFETPPTQEVESREIVNEHHSANDNILQNEPGEVTLEPELPETVQIFASEKESPSMEKSIADSGEDQQSQVEEIREETPAAPEIPIERASSEQNEPSLLTFQDIEPTVEEHRELVTSTITDVHEEQEPVEAIVPPQKPVSVNSEYLLPLILNDEGRIVTKTLAEIYVNQGELGEAIITYRLLKQQRPQFAAEYDQRINDLELQLKEKTSS